ncbi:MAG TPA: tetratricopeptide repeat protein [Candidatus Omnitrophota bacterium]|nr:tetratricopeptide repeat protein [Candidatus Omnitrophota bacterium]
MLNFFKKNKHILLCGFFLAWGALIYSNTYHAPFQFDDIPYILKDPHIRNVENWPALWSAYIKTRYLSFLTIALNYSFSNTHVLGYHLFNTVLHTLNACWVYGLFSLLLMTPKMRGVYSPNASFYLAAFSALIFLVHPLQTQAVAYIIQRMASLATFFYLGTIVLYLKSRMTQNKISYIAAILLAIAAMFTKEITITLPLALVFIEGLFFDHAGEKLKTWARLTPFLLTLAIIPYLLCGNRSLAALAQNPIPVTSASLLSRGDYFWTQVNVLCTYLRLYFIPIHQNLDYDYPMARSLLEPKTLFCFFLLGMLFIGAVVAIKKNRLLAFSVFWFFLTLSVESSIFPIEDVINEHRMYLPLAGLVVVIPILCLLFLEKLPHAILACLVIGLIFSSMTYLRNRVWGSKMSLYEDVVKKAPRKARGYNNLGSIYYYDFHDPAKAKKLYEKAIEVEPGFGPSYFDLGAVYDHAGDKEKAFELYQKALKLDPTFLDTYNNLAILYEKRGDLDSAIEILWKGIAQSPRFEMAYANLGAFYSRKGNISKAIACLKKGIEINPYFPLCYYNLGLILKSQGQWAEAITLFQKASSLDPDNPNMAYTLGEAYLQQGDSEAAGQVLNRLKKMGHWDKVRDLSARMNIPGTSF